MNMNDDFNKLRDELLKQHKEQLKKIDALIESSNKEFEVGKWYKTENYPQKAFVFLNKEYKEGAECFGIDGSGDWTDRWYCKPDTDNLRLANESEIKEALIKEAEKRGFKEGVKVNHKLFYDFKVDEFVMTKTPIRFLKPNIIDVEGTDGYYHTIYREGKWATIVLFQPIMIGGYKVEYRGDIFKIGCKTIKYSEVESLHTMMSRNEIFEITMLDHLININTLQDILNMK